MEMLPHHQGGFYGLQTISNGYYNNDDDDALDDFLHDIIDGEDDDETTMMNNTIHDHGSDSVMKLTRSSGLKSSWKRIKHAKSEQKRRQRINSHHATLRTLFPNLLKKDKASVLTEAVRRVKELKKTVSDIALEKDENGCSGGEGWFRSLPSENDEASVSHCNEDGKEGAKRVTMTICCDDSPNLNREVMNAICSVRGRAVRAEMSTVGGRTKVVVVVEWRENGGTGGGEEDVGSLRRALRALVENRAFQSTGLIGHRLADTKWAGLAHEVLDTRMGPLTDSSKDSLAEGLILRNSV